MIDDLWGRGLGGSVADAAEAEVSGQHDGICGAVGVEVIVAASESDGLSSMGRV